MRRAPAALALALAGCVAPAEPPTFSATDAGRIPVTATLSLPASGPAPVVVLMHGCSGVSRTHEAWAATLRGWGYAALVLDSFAARGIRAVCETGGLTSNSAWRTRSRP